jgi:hypothetical protein
MNSRWELADRAAVSLTRRIFQGHSDARVGLDHFFGPIGTALTNPMGGRVDPLSWSRRLERTPLVVLCSAWPSHQLAPPPICAADGAALRFQSPLDPGVSLGSCRALHLPGCRRGRHHPVRLCNIAFFAPLSASRSPPSQRRYWPPQCVASPHLKFL